MSAAPAPGRPTPPGEPGWQNPGVNTPRPIDPAGPGAAVATRAAGDAALPTLLVVSANYPFVLEGGEIAFMPPEIEVLARDGRFRLCVAPLRTAAQQLPLPAGVALDLGLAQAVRRGRWPDLLSAWRWPGFGAELWRALRHGGVVGLARVWRWAAAARATARWLAAAPPQAAVAYTFWRGGPTLALARWAEGAPGRAAITRVHRYELYEDCFRPPFQPWVSVYARLACTYTVSAHGLAYLRARGVPAQRLALARLGTPAAPARARASDDGVLRLVSCSFLRPEKRVPLLAQALVQLAARHPARTIAWTHLGDGPERAAVQAAVAAAPPNLRCVLAGHRRNDEVMAHYAGEPVDLFVQVSASEGLPVAIMEALSAGVPVIAADVGGVAEAVDAEVGRLLGPDPDAATVTSAIEDLGLRLGAAHRDGLRDAAWARWTQRFDAARNHAAFGAEIAARCAQRPADGVAA